jgi:hypothetical protein
MTSCLSHINYITLMIPKLLDLFKVSIKISMPKQHDSEDKKLRPSSIPAGLNIYKLVIHLHNERLLFYCEITRKIKILNTTEYILRKHGHAIHT